MFTAAIFGESLVRSIACRGVAPEVVLLPDTVWCGAMAYAPAGSDAPDIPTLLEQYRTLSAVPRRETPLPDWSACIRIDPRRPDAARGILFAQQVMTVRQDASHDVYVLPTAFYLRAAVGVENGLALPEDGAPHACFDALRAMLPELGYAPDDGGQEIAIRSRTGLAYAYVPIALE